MRQREDANLHSHELELGNVWHLLLEMIKLVAKYSSVHQRIHQLKPSAQIKFFAMKRL